MTHESMRFSATATITPDTTRPLTEKPITITARTSADAYQGYWGRCVHDFAGFRPPTRPIPLDSDHDTAKVIGMADQFKVVDGSLIASGKITPFKSDDAASEILFKASKGVPYQASIVMDPNNLKVEQVPEGKTVAVNGRMFTGPGTVFRKWSINGIAILPYGADSSTSVQFARGNAKPASQMQVLTQQVKAIWSGGKR